MVNTLFAVAALCMTSVLLCKVLERYAREQAVMLTIGTAAGVLLLLLTMLEPLLTQIHQLFQVVGLPDTYIAVLWKALGICYVTQLAGDVCRDSREEALCSVVHMAGKIALMVQALPLIRGLMSMISEVLG